MISLMHPDVSEISLFATYIGTAYIRSVPMYYYLSFRRRYIGIEISMSIPMYVGSNLWSSPICGVTSPLGIFELCN